MNKVKRISSIVQVKFFAVAFIICISFNSPAQEFTLTTTAANIISAKALIDLPGLTGKPDAIIVVTPLGNTKTLNPHPTGAWYYSGKWNIFNSDFAVMLPGLTYKVQYFVTPGVNQFLHLVTQQNLGSEGSYIDNPALNNKPDAQFLFLQNNSPDIRPGSWLNRFEEKAGYSTAAGRWYITNIGGQAMQKGCAYNIVISSSGSTSSTTNPVGNSTTDPCNCPTSLPPNGIAGGDLTGTYPNPTVQKLFGRSLSNTAPTTGQMLKWNGTEWAPANDNIGSASINNPESWKSNGTNISNSNSGNVGIGTTNPNAPLGFPATLGKKITLYPGTTGDVGFGVAGNRLQIYTDNPNADVAIGYDAAGTFNERFAVKANGAIAVNGDVGQSGQVLTSSGAGSPPIWKQPSGGATTPPTAPMQTFFKNGNSTTPWITFQQNWFAFTELQHNIILTKKSRLVISASAKIYPADCSFDCKVMSAIFSVGFNSAPNSNTPYYNVAISAAPNTGTTANISNFMIDLNPGNYAVTFSIWNHSGFGIRSIDQRQSSIMVIPLE